MKKYEYKIVNLKITGLFTKKDPKLEEELNVNANDGWRLKEIITPAKNFGETDKYILVLERERE